MSASSVKNSVIERVFINLGFGFILAVALFIGYRKFIGLLQFACTCAAPLTV